MKSHRIFFSNTNPTLIEDFIESVKGCYGYVPYRNSRTDFIILAKAVVNDLIRYSRFGSRKWSISNEIFSSEKDIQIAWINGYMDGDGSVDISKKEIFAKSVNLNGLKQVKELLRKLEIDSHIRGPYDGAYVLVVDDKDKYRKFINFVDPNKSMKLEKIV